MTADAHDVPEKESSAGGGDTALKAGGGLRTAGGHASGGGSGGGGLRGSGLGGPGTGACTGRCVGA